jgi:predicted RecB family nuclease
VSARSLTGCRHRLTLETRAATVPDASAALRVEAAQTFRDSVRDRLVGSDGFVVIEQGTDALARTAAAVAARAPRIWGAVLPTAEGRRGHAELLVRVGAGYVPVIVVNHKVADSGRGAVLTAADRWDPGPAETVKPRVHRADQMRLAHLTRMLQAAGWSATPGDAGAVGGSLGVDDPDRIVVHDVESLLPGYDERLADRLAVVRGEVVTEPNRVAECRRCPWWSGCEPQLAARRDLSLVTDPGTVAVLRAAGIGTVDELADYRGPAPAELTVPLRELRAVAAAWRQGSRLVRRRKEVRVRRADIEVDVDMESYQELGAYLWGTWTRVDGEQLGYRPFVTWDPLPTTDESRSFAGFWAYLMDHRAQAHAAGATFAAYCYSQQAENKWLLASADRFAGRPGIPTRAAVTEFITSPEWVDMFVEVGRAFITLDGRSLKKVAPQAGFGWRDPEAGGEASMLWYRVAVGMDPGSAADRVGQRNRLLEYNEDDVRATAALRDWMSGPEMDLLPVV